MPKTKYFFIIKIKNELFGCKIIKELINIKTIFDACFIQSYFVSYLLYLSNTYIKLFKIKHQKYKKVGHQWVKTIRNS